MKYICQEAYLLGLSAAVGIGLMILYDILRILRLFVRHSGFWVGLEDLGYWCVCALMVFYLLYRENDGRIRGYAVGCVFFAMMIYERYIGRIVIKRLKKLLRCFKINAVRRHKKEP